MSSYTLTRNQESVLKVLANNKSFHNKPFDEQMDIDQLIDEVNYNVSKEAIQFTLRSLRKRGYTQKGANLVYRRNKRRVVWALTTAGRDFMLKKSS